MICRPQARDVLSPHRGGVRLYSFLSLLLSLSVRLMRRLQPDLPSLQLRPLRGSDTRLCPKWLVLGAFPSPRSH